MIGKTFSAAMLALTPGLILAQSTDNYEQVFKQFGSTSPSELKPTSNSAKLFGQVVAVSNGLVAVSSNELTINYDSSDQVSKRGRISVFGADYLRRYEDSGVDFVSSKINDGYGSSLALWHGTMLVGAPNDNTGGENVGKAYVYFGTNLATVQTLTAEHGEAGDYFGYSVAIVHGQGYYSAGMAVVGAYGHDHDKESTVGQGCVFVYALDSGNLWNVVGKLEPQDFEHKDHGGFGYSLSAYGNTVAVGTYSTDNAFVFELMGHLHECPHGHEGEGEQDLPEDCLDERRNLRALQGPPEDEKKWYTEWQYDHILTVGIEEEHKDEKEKEANSYSFGHTVALYNSSGVLTLAVGAPDGVNDGAHVGMVYVMSIMNRGNVEDGWYPDGYDHHDEDKQKEEAQHEAEQQEREAEEQERKEQEETERQEKEAQEESDRQEKEDQEESDRQDREDQEQGEREEREGQEEGEREDREGQEQGDRDGQEQGDRNDHNQKRALQVEEDKNRFRTWNIMSDNSFCGDKMGNFWVLEAVMAGGHENERFGYSLAISANILMIGNNPSSYQTGRAVYFERWVGTSSIEKNPLVSGPLFNTAWAYSGALADTSGMEGDHFGFSVSYDGGNVAVVGAIMNDIQSDGTFGQGVAYVYDRITMSNVAPTPSPTPAPTPTPAPVVGAAVEEGPATLLDQVTDTHTAMGITFLSSTSVVAFAFVLVCAYSVYRGAGGEASPRELLCGLVTPSPPASKQVRLATMDDSGFSTKSTSSTGSRQGLQSAYSGIDTSSAHGLNRLPARPSPAPPPPQRGPSKTGPKAGAGAGPGASGASRTFTPQAQRSFTPKARANNEL